MGDDEEAGTIARYVTEAECSDAPCTALERRAQE